MGKTIGYIRVSSDKQTVDNQRLAILDYCNKQDIKFDHWITKEGKDYNNTYCNVIRIQDGKIAEVTEYCDTALVNAVLHRE